ncbi:hypothetical protein PCE1_000058 [Barthelona sp. PCE]
MSDTITPSTQSTGLSSSGISSPTAHYSKPQFEDLSYLRDIPARVDTGPHQPPQHNTQKEEEESKESPKPKIDIAAVAEKIKKNAEIILLKKKKARREKERREKERIERLRKVDEFNKRQFEKQRNRVIEQEKRKKAEKKRQEKETEELKLRQKAEKKRLDDKRRMEAVRSLQSRYKTNPPKPRKRISKDKLRKQKILEKKRRIAEFDKKTRQRLQEEQKEEERKREERKKQASRVVMPVVVERSQPEPEPQVIEPLQPITVAQPIEKPADHSQSVGQFVILDLDSSSDSEIVSLDSINIAAVIDEVIVMDETPSHDEQNIVIIDERDGLKPLREKIDSLSVLFESLPDFTEDSTDITQYAEKQGPVVDNVFEMPDPIVMYEEPEPIVHEEPEPVVHEEPEPVVHEEPEPVVTHEAPPIVIQNNENYDELLSQYQRMERWMASLSSAVVSREDETADDMKMQISQIQEELVTLKESVDTFVDAYSTRESANKVLHDSFEPVPVVEPVSIEPTVEPIPEPVIKAAVDQEKDDRDIVFDLLLSSHRTVESACLDDGFSVISVLMRQKKELLETQPVFTIPGEAPKWSDDALSLPTPAQLQAEIDELQEIMEESSIDVDVSESIIQHRLEELGLIIHEPVPSVISHISAIPMEDSHSEMSESEVLSEFNAEDIVVEDEEDDRVRYHPDDLDALAMQSLEAMDRSREHENMLMGLESSYAHSIRTQQQHMLEDAIPAATVSQFVPEAVNEGRFMHYPTTPETTTTSETPILKKSNIMPLEPISSEREPSRHVQVHVEPMVPMDKVVTHEENTQTMKQDVEEDRLPFTDEIAKHLWSYDTEGGVLESQTKRQVQAHLLRRDFEAGSAVVYSKLEKLTDSIVPLVSKPPPTVIPQEEPVIVEEPVVMKKIVISDEVVVVEPVVEQQEESDEASVNDEDEQNSPFIGEDRTRSIRSLDFMLEKPKDVTSIEEFIPTEPKETSAVVSSLESVGSELFELQTLIETSIDIPNGNSFNALFKCLLDDTYSFLHTKDIELVPEVYLSFLICSYLNLQFSNDIQILIIGDTADQMAKIGSLISKIMPVQVDMIFGDFPLKSNCPVGLMTANVYLNWSHSCDMVVCFCKNVSSKIFSLLIEEEGRQLNHVIFVNNDILVKKLLDDHNVSYIFSSAFPFSQDDVDEAELCRDLQASRIFINYDNNGRTSIPLSSSPLIGTSTPYNQFELERKSDTFVVQDNDNQEQVHHALNLNKVDVVSMNDAVGQPNNVGNEKRTELLKTHSDLASEFLFQSMRESALLIDSSSSSSPPLSQDAVTSLSTTTSEEFFLETSLNVALNEPFEPSGLKYSETGSVSSEVSPTNSIDDETLESSDKVGFMGYDVIEATPKTLELLDELYSYEQVFYKTASLDLLKLTTFKDKTITTFQENGLKVFRQFVETRSSCIYLYPYRHDFYMFMKLFNCFTNGFVVKKPEDLYPFESEYESIDQKPDEPAAFVININSLMKYLIYLEESLLEYVVPQFLKKKSSIVLLVVDSLDDDVYMFIRKFFSPDVLDSFEQNVFIHNNEPEIDYFDFYTLNSEGAETATSVSSISMSPQDTANEETQVVADEIPTTLPVTVSSSTSFEIADIVVEEEETKSPSPPKSPRHFIDTIKRSTKQHTASPLLSTSPMLESIKKEVEGAVLSDYKENSVELALDSLTYTIFEEEIRKLVEKGLIIPSKMLLIQLKLKYAVIDEASDTFELDDMGSFEFDEDILNLPVMYDNSTLVSAPETFVIQRLVLGFLFGVCVFFPVGVPVVSVPSSDDLLKISNLPVGDVFDNIRGIFNPQLVPIIEDYLTPIPTNNPIETLIYSQTWPLFLDLFTVICSRFIGSSYQYPSSVSGDVSRYMSNDSRASLAELIMTYLFDILINGGRSNF